MEPTIEVMDRALPVQAPADILWNALQSETWCGGTSDVRTLIFGPFEADSREVKWLVWLKGFELGWRESQHRDPVARSLAFQQVEGMFFALRGYWHVVSVSSSRSELQLHLEFGSGMPYLSRFIDPVLARALFSFFVQVLESIARRALAESLSSRDAGETPHAIAATSSQ